MRAREAVRSFPADMHVVETQKTRRGTGRTGGATRPYRFGEFDLLAVSLYLSTNRWDAFLYTVAGWLLPEPKNSSDIRKFQPVAMAPNEDWTDDFDTVVAWYRSGEGKTIRAAREA